MGTELNILIIDDDPDFLNETKEMLENLNYNVLIANHPHKGLELIKKNKLDLILLDIILPDINGFDVLKKISSDYPELKVFMVTNDGDENNILRALRLGATDFLRKPFNQVELRDALIRANVFCEKRKKYQEIENHYKIICNELRNRYGKELIGKSKRIKEIINLIDKVAKSNLASVFISGERGTGKELVARAIHYLSKRKNCIFYPINCSSIPENLFESELFGHVKGSFTSAVRDQKGAFEIANNGTIFLDEIGDMPIQQQSKLLRVLEEKKIRNLGSHLSIDLNIRVIAASYQDIEQLINEKKFKADLFDRINTFPIELPPLRDRKDDIPLLFDYFVSKFSIENKKKIKHIDKNIYYHLNNYDFPGNVRELKNLVERAVILCENNHITSNDIIPYIKLSNTELSFDKDLNLKMNKKNLVFFALKRTNGHQLNAAKLLGIDKSKMTRLMHEFDISKDQFKN